MRCIVALNIRAGARTHAADLCRYLDSLHPDTVLLTEWRDNAGGRTFVSWAERRGMSYASLTDGCTPNGSAPELWGALRGTVKIPPGTDLTQGTGEVWEADT